MSKLIGIDLGTTNSCVAVMDGDTPVIIPNENGGRTTPSVVAITPQGEHLVGEVAKRQAAVNPDRTIRSIKRDMGTPRKIKIDGRTYSPAEISAMILQKLKKDAENYLGEPVTDAVITVPAYFSDAQRQATKDAGLIAGLNVQRIINEPTAAALAYGVDKEHAQKIMVFDLGGGTFDVSILDIGNGVIQVLATSGNNRLGGDDFDEAIANWLLAEFKRQCHIDLSRDAVARQRIREAAEQAKIELSSRSSTMVNLPFLTTGKSGPLHMDLTLTREKFNELTAPLVQSCLGPVRQALNDARVRQAELSKVLLVGGSTRIPAVQEAVKRFTGKEPFKGVNPDECVAIGASLQGGVLAGTNKSLLLLDMTPMSLGVETLGNVCARLIDRNSTLPVSKSDIFTTSMPYQPWVEINVLQGESRQASDNQSLGRFRLTGIRRAPAGVPRIQVTFDIDVNGIVHVSAMDLDTGQQQGITITGSRNMSPHELNRAIVAARDYAAAEQGQQDLTAARNRDEQLMYRGRDLLAACSPADHQRLEQAMRRADRAGYGTDAAAIHAACDALEQIINEIEGR